MALQLTMPQPVGVSAVYHRVRSVVIDYVAGQTTITVEGFVSQAAAATMQPIAGSTLTVAQLPTAGVDPRVWAYQALQARPEWAAATTVVGAKE